MIEILSRLEGEHFDLFKLEQKLKPKGYSIGGNWDYDQGAFDYKMTDDGAYRFLRLPFTAVDGQLDDSNCTVKFGRPYLLSHVYQQGLDDQAHSDNSSATFNQFQEPVDKDGEIPENYLEMGKALVKELESLLLVQT
jgi:hypothetical protein